MATIFGTGAPQVISDVLENRDQRVQFQQNLLQRFPNAAIVAIKLNIPGPIKNNVAITRLFNTGVTRFYDRLKVVTRHFQTVAEWHKPTGNELFLVIDLPARQVKRLAVAFEDQDHLGRLFDVDVLTADEPKALSRSDFQLPARKCLICNRMAKDCSRSRRHSVADLQEKINQIYCDEFMVDGGSEPWMNR